MPEMPPVFVHAADLHLGAPLRELGKGINDEARRNLVNLVNTAFDNLINESIRLKAEFVVLAGDIYDGADREAHAQIRFSLGLKKLVDAGIGVYIVHGNHDPVLGGIINVVSLPEGVTVFGTDKVSQVRHTMRDGRAVVVAGVSYESAHDRRPLATMFNGISRDGAVAVVGVLHTNLGGVSTAHNNYAPSSEADLAAAPVDYWALGHVHKRQVRPIGQNRYWAYPGNLQGRDAGEPGEKGALVVPILDHGVGEPQFLPMDAFHFANIAIDCTDAADLGPIAGLIREKCTGLSSGKPLLIRVTLHGYSAAHAAVSSTSNIEQAIELLCGDALNGGHIEKIVSHLLPEVDIHTLRTADDLLGDLLMAVENLAPGDFDPETAGLDPSLLTPDRLTDMRNAMTADFLLGFYDATEGAA